MPPKTIRTIQKAFFVFIVYDMRIFTLKNIPPINIIFFLLFGCEAKQYIYLRK